jgi:hypothetical protein
MTDPTPNTSARLLSKAERDKVRGWGWNREDDPELMALFDTADHWEAEAAKWEGIISQIGCEVTHYRLDHHAESSMKAIDKIFGFPIPEHSEVTRLRGVLREIRREMDHRLGSPNDKFFNIAAILAKAEASPPSGSET